MQWIFFLKYHGDFVGGLRVWRFPLFGQIHVFIYTHQLRRLLMVMFLSSIMFSVQRVVTYV